ncbi:MAG: carboxylesterase family protein [bacterium]|nr:carboxylesterase family protein [bacterium]
MTDQKTISTLQAQGPVKLNSGLIEGSLTGEGNTISVYKGIPYAAPPVGDLRWRPPVPVNGWEGIRPATEFGPIQPQRISPASGGVTSEMEQSEDCLYLNVWTSSAEKSERLPVMIWFHGGAFEIGAGSVPGYDGTKLAEKGVVVVTCNYRLGIFGMFAHPLLTEESENNASGNYSLLDQIQVLKWVQQNISQFGGDPNRVTIVGESAGSRSVTLLMVSPLAKGLFHRGICQSGAAREVSEPLTVREEKGVEIAEKLDAKSLEELRTKSYDELTAVKNFSAHPIVDGWVIPEDPVTLYAQGKQFRLPLIIGFNHDEVTMFIRESPVKTREDFTRFIGLRFGDRADEVLKLYSPSSDEEVHDTLNRAFTDVAFIQHARKQLRWMNAAGINSYAYYFTRVPPTLAGKHLRAHHGAEIAYVFGNIGSQWGEATDIDRALSETMMTYWTQFAASGDPNTENLSRWPVYETSCDPYLVLGESIQVENQLHKPSLDLLDELE